MSLFGHLEGTWKTLVGLTALSLAFACMLIVFEALFVGITFAWPPAPDVCRIGTGIWAGSFGATCATILMIALCRRKEEFSKCHTAWFCVGLCSLSIASDCALIVLEALCLTTDKRSELPVFLLSAGGVHVVCSISAVFLFYLLWKSARIAEKEKEISKASPLDQRRMIIIPNILQSHPSFVSIELN